MANEWKKDFNVMLRDDKGMPKVEIVIDPNTIRKYGGKRMYFAPPLEYDRVLGQRAAWRGWDILVESFESER